MKKKLLVFLLFICSFSIIGQQYPVQLLTNVPAPAPVNFYNYADDTSLNSPITVQIFLNDLTITNRQIKLKTYFEGGNIQFQSKDFVLGAETLFIDGGIPLTLTNVDLAPYYKFENIQGIGAATYGESIPEGSYDFCFEVFDYLTGSKLSAKKCAKIFIFKNEPPLLNLPFNGSNIEPKDFENIVFQWTPRHLNVSNVEYELSIVEVWDNNISPQTAFLSQIPIYQETTRATSILYGPDKPQLLPGKKYAWRVQAKALQGLEEIGLFKKEGYSEIFWFSRALPCESPNGIAAEPKGLTKMNVYWNENPTEYSEYIIAYREANKPDAYWFTKKTNSSWATIWNLKPGTTYEYKVKGKCTYQYSEYSEIQEVTTEIIQNDDANYQCGIVPDEIAITNKEPHPGLIEGSEITAGDFKVVITKITNQSPGALSGNGYVRIPYLKFVKFAVNFNNILVNTNNELAKGEIVTVYDPNFGEGTSMDVDVDVDVSEGINGDNGEMDALVEVDFVITDVTINEDGALVVTGVNVDGEPATAIVPGDKDVSIKSENGDVWSYGEDGTITKSEGAEGGAVVTDTTNGVDSEGQLTEITAKGVLVTFEKSGYYSYDALPNGVSAELEAEYKIINTHEGNKYKVSYKAISDNKGEDFIYANVHISDTNIVKDNIIFKTKDGVKLNPVSWDGNRAKLKLVRKFHYVDEEIVAVIKNKEGTYDVAGVLIAKHLASQELEPINVVLVPVGAAIDHSIIAKTKEIYEKAGVRLNITIKDKVAIDQVYGLDQIQRINVGNSNLLSHYTEDEKLFNNYVKKQTYYNQNSYYIFVTNKPVTGNGVRGFMPLKSQFGFVFTNNATTVVKQAKTLAHELGHGIFGLEHSWDKYKYGKETTNFLMDNGNGTVLNHLDWKKIHADGISIYLFQDDKDGEQNNRYEDLINYQFLVDWIKDNYGNPSVPYDIEKFIIASKLVYFRKLDKVKELAYSVPFEYNGRKLELKGSLSKEKGNVDLSKVFMTLDLELNEKHSYTDVIKFSDPENHTDKDAVRITIEDVRDYEEYIAYTGINFNKNDVSEKFKEEFKKAGNDCDKLDFLYEHAPTFIIDQRSEFHWNDIKKLASCSVDGWGTDEEIAIIKLIDGIGRKNPKELLDGLLEHKIDDKTLFRTIYEAIDNYGGEDNFTTYIKYLYKFWRQTDYANQETELYIPYSSKKILGFYSDEFITYFHTKKNEIRIAKKGEIRISSNYHGQVDDYEHIGSFGFYSKINLLNNTQEGDGMQIPTAEVPTFYLKAFKEVNSTANWETGTSLAFDVVTTISGVGNLVKLKHLTHLTKLEKGLKYSIAGAEITAGTLNAMLTLSNNCDNAAFCKELRVHLFWLEMGSLGLDVFTQQMIKKTARKALEKADDKVDVLITDELAKVAGVKNATQNLLTKLDELNLENLKSKFNKLDETTKDKFLNDFENLSPSDLTKLAQNDAQLVEVWKKWGDADNNLVKAANNRIYKLDDLKAFERVYNRKERYITFDDFYLKTIYQIKDVTALKKEGYKQFAVELFEAWDNGYKNGKSVSEMEAVYTKYGLKPNEVYPPNEGVWGLLSEPRAPKLNEKFDRFQTREALGGGYAGYLENPNVVPTVSARALKENYSEIVSNGEDYFYFLFEIKKVPAGVKFEFGEAMPWFGETGGAIQIKSSKGLHELGDYINITEKWKLVEGKWVKDLRTSIKNKFPENLGSLLDDASDQLLNKLDNLEAEGKLSRFIDDFKDNLTTFSEFKKNTDLIDSWKILDNVNSSLKTNIDELTDVSKHLDAIEKFGNYTNWRLRTGRFKHSNWVQVDDVANKVAAKEPHVLKVETRANGTFYPKTKTKSGKTFQMKGFKGCHSENALKEYIQAHGGNYTVKNKSMGQGGVYEGQPVIYIDNKEYVKINGRFVEYEPGKLGGTSSFFPETWSNAKIKQEVEHAVKNNHGLAPDGSNSYFGYSQDGVVEIRFYLKNDESIGSYFPKKI